MSALSPVDVLIVGAGPVGLFLANALHRHGLTCRLIDKKAHLSVHSKALGWHARSLEIFMDTGDIDAIKQQGLPVEKFSVLFKNKTLASLSFNHIDAPHPCVLMLPQDKTEKIFYDHLREKQIDVDWRHELVAFQQDEKKITAQIKSPDGQMQTQIAKWMVGADGAHSTLRHLLNFDFVGAPYPEYWWLVDCYVDWEKPNDQAFVFFTPSGPLPFFPIGEGRHRLIMMADQKSNEPPTFEQIKTRVARLCDEPLTLSHPLWISAFTLHHRQVKQYRDRRAFLVGDAAHIHSPVGGQGLNTGIQDAYNLAWKLAWVEKQSAPEHLLESYHQERYAVGKAVVSATDRATRWVMLKNPIAIRLRNLFISILSSFKFIREKMVVQLAELSIHYRKSPLSQQCGHFYGIKAGDLVPNRSLYDEQGRAHNIFTVLDGHRFTLLYFAGSGDDNESTEALNQFLQRQADCVDCHGVFSKPPKTPWPGKIWIDPQATKQGLLMIRPDQYVGFVSDKIAIGKLNEWFLLFVPAL